jgi:hypothetical protein
MKIKLGKNLIGGANLPKNLWRIQILFLVTVQGGRPTFEYLFTSTRLVFLFK